MNLTALDVYNGRSPDKEVMSAHEYYKWLQFLPPDAEVSIATFSIGKVRDRHGFANTTYDWMEKMRSVRILFGNPADRYKAEELACVPTVTCRYIKNQHSKIGLFRIAGKRSLIVYCGSMNLCYPLNTEVMAKVTQPQQLHTMYEQLWKAGKNICPKKKESVTPTSPNSRRRKPL